MKNRVRKPAAVISNSILLAAFAVIILGRLRQAILDGRAIQVAMLGVVVIALGVLVLRSNHRQRTLKANLLAGLSV